MGSEAGADTRGAGDHMLITHHDIPPVLRRVHANSSRHLNDALCLYAAQRPQGAIPPLVLSVEEHLKGIYLAIAHRGKKGITASEWAELQSHTFKLQKVKPCADNELSKGELAKVCSLHAHDADPLTAMRAVSSPVTIKFNHAVTQVTPALQLLARACIYHNWDKKTSKWDMFGFFSLDAQRALAFYLLQLARFYHDLLAQVAGQGIEFSCPMACRSLSQMPRNPLESSTGGIILRAVQGTGHVSTHAHEITTSILVLCRRVESLSVDRANLHPLVRALSMYNSEQPELQDGKREYASSDSAQTRAGETAMRVSVSMSAQGGLRKIEQITANDTACDVHDCRIAMVLEAERFIGRRPGETVPLPAIHELFSKLGIQACALRGDDIADALASAHQMLGAGHLRHYPPHIANSIKLATAKDWDYLDPQARNVVCALHRHSPAAIALAAGTDLERKHVARTTVWDALCSQKMVHDGRSMGRSRVHG